MKKLVSMLLVVALVVALAACGGGNEGAADGMKAGTYTGEGRGHGGPIKVEVVVGDDGKVSAVNVVEQNETEGIGSLALDSLPGEVVENNGTEGVDTVSGATESSEGFFNAVNAALEQAK